MDGICKNRFVSLTTKGCFESEKKILSVTYLLMMRLGLQEAMISKKREHKAEVIR